MANSNLFRDQIWMGGATLCEKFLFGMSQDLGKGQPEIELSRLLCFFSFHGNNVAIKALLVHHALMIFLYLVIFGM